MGMDAKTIWWVGTREDDIGLETLSGSLPDTLCDSDGWGDLAGEGSVSVDMDRICTENNSGGWGTEILRHGWENDARPLDFGKLQQETAWIVGRLRDEFRQVGLPPELVGVYMLVDYS